MIIDLGYWTKVFKRILIALLTIIGLYFAFKLSIFYMPFLIAFIFAIIIEPLIRYVKRKTNLTRKTSAIIVLSVVSILIIGIIALGVITLIDEASGLLQGLNGYYDDIYAKVQNIINSFNMSSLQLPQEVQNIVEASTSQVLEKVSKWVQELLTSFLDSLTSIPTIAIYIGITLMSIYFICADRLYILDQLEHHLPQTWVKKLGIHIKEMTSALGSFLKAEVILVFIAFVQVLIGLYLMKFMGFNVQYPLLAAILIGFVDALPILGSGTIMIPWAVISAINGDLKMGLFILGLWGIIMIIRQLIEPKIVSKQIGIHPIFTIIAMYTGLKVMGIMGLIFGPIILIILKNIFATLIEKGVFKSIFERT